jgi:hypothetical protein
MIPTSFNAVPDVVGARIGPLRECLELTLLHAALAARKLHPTMVQALIADNLVNQSVDMISDIDEIDPPIQPEDLTRIVRFNGSISTSASVDCFIRSLTPHILWEYAEEETQIALAIRLAAIEIRRVGGCPSPEHNCERFSIGPSFLHSLRAWEGDRQSKYAGSTLDGCARIVACMPKDQPSRLFKRSGSKGKAENVVRSSDSAQAWRTHISMEHEAMRLMFWRKSDGSIEFANIGAKAELEIF